MIIRFSKGDKGSLVNDSYNLDILMHTDNFGNLPKEQVARK